MEVQRTDTIRKYFDKVETVKLVNNILVILIFLFSLGVLYLDKTKVRLYENISIILVILVILNFIVNAYKKFYSIPLALEKRKRHLLGDSFNIEFDEEITVGYYNNRESPSIRRLGASTFENVFFTLNVVKKMLVKERIKIFIFIILSTIALLNRKTDLDFILIISQTLFATDVILDYLGLEYTCFKLEGIYEELNTLFMMGNSENETYYETSLLEQFTKYECLKALTSLQTSQKVFETLNQNLSAEWETIKVRVGIK